MIKKINSVFSLLLLIFFIFSNQQVVLATIDTQSPAVTETQQSMSDESCQAYQQEDKKMNNLYRSLKKSYQKDDDLLKNLKKAQRRWLKFRDAHVDMMYPKIKNNSRAASSRTMCRCILLASMTNTRNHQLRDILTPEEGDICALPAPAMPNSQYP